MPDVVFVDLQYGDTDTEQTAFRAETGISLKRIPGIDNFRDLDDLASLIDACDVILAVSNTTAHLASALGKNVMVMLPYFSGLLWYWHQDRSDSPWYPTARLFRQDKIGDWNSVITQVKQVLKENIKALTKSR
jgi:ADP-heptose:LPS heptosyltransferase